MAYYVRKFEEDKLGFKVSDIDKQTFSNVRKILSIAGRTRASQAMDILKWVKENCLK